MTEHLNRRTFIGLFTGIAAFLGFTQKAKAEKPYTEEELEAPSRPMLSNANFHESGKAYGMVDRLTFPDKALVPKKPAVFDVGEIDVIGQVVGVAMRLESKKPRHGRNGSVPEESPNP